jgi:hypothetical protein
MQTKLPPAAEVSDLFDEIWADPAKDGHHDHDHADHHLAMVEQADHAHTDDQGKTVEQDRPVDHV